MTKTLKAELIQFTLTTSIQDILTKRSSFNPYPSQAIEGMLVSSSIQPTSNPMMWIKYLATGNVYHVTEPISFPVETFQAPKVGEDKDAPLYHDINGEPLGERWITLEEFYKGLSYDVVESGFFKGPNFRETLASAVVIAHSPGDGRPIFYRPKDAYLAIVRAAIFCLETGDPETAYSIIGIGFNVGAYHIRDKEYFREAFEVFDYTHHDLAGDACHYVMRDYPGQIQRRGVHTEVDDITAEVHAIVVYTIKAKALERALDKHEGTAQMHIRYMLEESQQKLQHACEKLASRIPKSDSWHTRMAHAEPDLEIDNYYSQAVRYFLKNGIRL